MGLDCEYPNSCDCGCQDEPRHTGCKCCGRETEHSDDCLIPENNRLRAALQKAEAERDALRTRLAPSMEYADGQAVGYGDDEIDRLTGALTRLVLRITELETAQDWPTSWPQTEDARLLLRRRK